MGGKKCYAILATLLLPLLSRMKITPNSILSALLLPSAVARSLASPHVTHIQKEDDQNSFPQSPLEPLLPFEFRSGSSCPAHS